MKNTHWVLITVLGCPLACANAAVVDLSNPDYTEQSVIPSEGGVFLDVEENCGVSFGGLAQKINKNTRIDEVLDSQEVQHGYENIIYRCNQYFAQFSWLTIQ